LGAGTIARALEDKVDGILVFDDIKHHARSTKDVVDTTTPTTSGMQLFRHGPRVQHAVSITTGTAESIQSDGKREKSTARKNVLPSHRMIDHQALFASKEKGCIDQGVLVHGDALFQTLLKKNQHKAGKMKLPHKGIVVETIRSKARLRLLQKNTS